MKKNVKLFDEAVSEPPAPIQTERMVLRHLKEGEDEIFDRHFQADEDFTRLLSGEAYTRGVREAILFYLTKKPDYFVMENAETHLPMGYVALHIKNRTGTIEYYVFQEYRRRGFCREAVKALIGAAFNGKLKETFGYYTEEERYHSYFTPVDLIKARVFEYNRASENVLRALGFTYSGYDFGSRLFPDDSRVTEKLFYLEKPKAD